MKQSLKSFLKIMAAIGLIVLSGILLKQIALSEFSKRQALHESSDSMRQNK